MGRVGGGGKAGEDQRKIPTFTEFICILFSGCYSRHQAGCVFFV